MGIYVMHQRTYRMEIKKKFKTACHARKGTYCLSMRSMRVPTTNLRKCLTASHKCRLVELGEEEKESKKCKHRGVKAEAEVMYSL